MDVEVPSWDEFNEVRDESVVSAVVNGAGNLILTTRGGAQINAGSVASPLAVWPVGSIYVGTTPTSPQTLFGGTWSRFANGKVLVGLDETDPDFDTVLETRGSKTHLLQAEESGLPVTNAVLQENGALFYFNTGGDADPTHRATTTGAPQDAAQAHNNIQPSIVVYMWRRTA